MNTPSHTLRALVSPLGLATVTTMLASAGAATAQVATETHAAEIGSAVRIERVVAYGEGCPVDSYQATLAPNGRTVVIRFTKFAPAVTPDASRVADDCRLGIVFRAPVGASHRVEGFHLRGYAYLEPGVEADLSTSHYFQLDQSKSEQLRTTVRGPHDGDYDLESPSLQPDLWSPCGLTEYQTLNVQLHVQLRNGAGGSPLADGTVEVHDGLGIDLAWRTCR